MSLGSISDSSNYAPLRVLADLCQYRTETGNVSCHPFCTLLTQLSNWLVTDSFTEAAGREFVKLSFLGPFLATASLFAEDDSRIVTILDDAVTGTFSRNSPEEKIRHITSRLQQEVELTRTLLLKVSRSNGIYICYTLLTQTFLFILLYRFSMHC